METGGWAGGGKLVAVLSAATDALTALPVSVSRLSGSDLVRVLSLVDGLAAVAAAGRFTLAAEAQERGEVDASQAGSLRAWVADACPSLDAREAGVVAKAVRELTVPALEPARSAVAAGTLSVTTGSVVAAELSQLRPLLAPGAEDAVLAGLITAGRLDGSMGVRAVRPALLARYGLGAALQELDDRRAGMTVLSCGRDVGGGITEYRMRLTPESRAVVEAAVNTLAAPAVAGGVRDARTVDQRRGDALVDVCRRATALTRAALAAPVDGAAVGGAAVGGVAVGADPVALDGAVREAYRSGAAPTGVKATVLVTISMADLVARTRPATMVGGVDAGTVLGPETVRRLACDAAVIPVVLDPDGQVLQLGRTRRLFSPAQIRALWLRDRHCTFPGCDTPATWCDAHHLRHWADGGPTDLTNAALVCPRHHTIAHRDRLHATHTATGITWDTIPGSYDHALARGPSPGSGEALAG